MPDLLATGAAWLAGVMKEHVGQPITYKRGSDTAQLVATVGATTRELTKVESATTIVRTVDFIVMTDDLVIGGNAISPKKGDKIEWLGRTYGVLPVADEPESRPSDQHEQRTRIHTKRIT